MVCLWAVAVAVRELGLGLGLRDDQLVLHGLPIRPIFSKKLPSKSALRKKLVSRGMQACMHALKHVFDLRHNSRTEHEAGVH